MLDFSSKEQECRQDVLRRLQKLLDILERHIDELHEIPEKKNMRPGECEQAIDRHIVLMLRILQMRQQFVEAERKAGDQPSLDDLLASGEETHLVS